MHCFTSLLCATFVGLSRSHGSPRSCRKKRFACEFSTVTLVLSERLLAGTYIGNRALTGMLNRASAFSVLTRSGCRWSSELQSWRSLVVYFYTLFKNSFESNSKCIASLFCWSCVAVWMMVQDLS